MEPEPGYRWGNFSFQLCSIPMYLCIIVPCLKEGTVRQAMYTFMMTYNLVGGFIAFFEPSGLFHGHWTLTFHALIWHMILVFVGVYIGFSGRGGQDLYRYKYAMRLFFVLCMIAYGFNLIFWEVSAHEVGVFFLGPKDPSIIVFKQIAETFGWVVSNVLYILSLCLGAYLVFILFRLVCKRMDLKVEPSNPEQKKEPAEML